MGQRAKRGAWVVWGMGLAVACGAPASAWAKKVCHEEREQIVLTGHLAHRAFAGAPNYESVKRGDARDNVTVLHLAHPLCVRAPGTDDPRLKNRELKTLLVLGAEDRTPASPKQAYRVSGHLVFAESGHHHLPVMLEVDDIEGLPKRRR